MRMIEIIALSNGAHNNQIINGATPEVFPVPEGWAVIHEDEECKNFPFGSFEVETVDGVPYMKKDSWVPGVIPEPEQPTPAQQREEIYNTGKIIEWAGDSLTVTEAGTLWQYYSAEGSPKADELQILIAAAKAKIREMYPDKGRDGI